MLKAARLGFSGQSSLTETLTDHSSISLNAQVNLFLLKFLKWRVSWEFLIITRYSLYGNVTSNIDSYFIYHS